MRNQLSKKGTKEAFMGCNLVWLVRRSPLITYFHSHLHGATTICYFHGLEGLNIIVVFVAYGRKEQVMMLLIVPDSQIIASYSVSNIEMIMFSTKKWEEAPSCMTARYDTIRIYCRRVKYQVWWLQKGSTHSLILLDISTSIVFRMEFGNSIQVEN